MKLIKKLSNVGGNKCIILNKMLIELLNIENEVKITVIDGKLIIERTDK